jgi:hypothetical protein
LRRPFLPPGPKRSVMSSSTTAHAVGRDNSRGGPVRTRARRRTPPAARAG